MNFHFLTPTNSLIALTTVLCICSIFIYSFLKDRAKKKLVSIILKLTFILLLIFALSTPSITYKKIINIKKKILVIVDSSKSMADGTTLNSNITTNLNNAKKHVILIKKLSLLPVDFLHGTDFVKKTKIKIPLEYTPFNLQNAFDESMNPEISCSFIITDANRNFNDTTYNGNAPIYFISNTGNRHDMYIKNASLNDEVLEDKIINNSNIKWSTLSVYSKKNLILRKKIFLKNRLSKIREIINSRLIKTKSIKIVIHGNKREPNTENNVFFVKAQKKEDKKPIYLFFSRPSFDTRFLIRHLKLAGKYNVIVKIPKYNEKLVIPKLHRNAIVFAGALDLSNIQGVNNLKAFVKNGGTLFFWNKGTNLLNQNASQLMDILPFSTNKKLSYNASSKINITNQGLKRTFINFRDISKANEVWKDFSNIVPDTYQIKPKRYAKVYLKFDKNPVFIMGKHGRGRVYAMFLNSLWKMDFSSLGYGIETNYFDLFFDELIQINSMMPRELVYIPNPVARAGQKIRVIASPFIKHKKSFIYVKLKTGIKRFYFTKRHGILYTDITLNVPGKYSLYIKGKNTVIGTIYFNYPEEELSISTQRENLKSVLTNSLVKLIKPENIPKILKKLKNSIITKEIKRTFKFANTLLFTLLMILIILASWFINKA